MAGTGDAIEALYRVFGRYSARRAIEACPCCVGTEAAARLETVPLRELDGDLLDHYALRAITTWGDVDDFKRFLPRILEVLSTALDGFLSTEILLGKLDVAAWATWPVDEREVVLAYLDALWIEILSQETEDEVDGRADTLLAGLGQAGDDLERRLAIWVGFEATASILHLANFVNANVPHLLRKGRLWNAHWSSRRDQEEIVIQWVRSPAVYERLVSVEPARFGDVVDACFRLEALAGHGGDR